MLLTLGSALMWMLKAILLLILCWVINAISSTYFNVSVLKKEFSKARLIEGIKKILVLTITAMGLATIIILLMEFTKQAGIPDLIPNTISIGAIVVIFANKCYYYIKQILENLKGMMEIKKE